MLDNELFCIVRQTATSTIVDGEVVYAFTPIYLGYGLQTRKSKNNKQEVDNRDAIFIEQVRLEPPVSADLKNGDYIMRIKPVDGQVFEIFSSNVNTCTYTNNSLQVTVNNTLYTIYPQDFYWQTMNVNKVYDPEDLSDLWHITLSLKRLDTAIYELT